MNKDDDVCENCEMYDTIYGEYLHPIYLCKMSDYEVRPGSTCNEYKEKVK